MHRVTLVSDSSQSWVRIACASSGVISGPVGQTFDAALNLVAEKFDAAAEVVDGPAVGFASFAEDPENIAHWAEESDYVASTVTGKAAGIGPVMIEIGRSFADFDRTV